jgi:hypothetical protein
MQIMCAALVAVVHAYEQGAAKVGELFIGVSAQLDVLGKQFGSSANHDHNALS